MDTTENKVEIGFTITGDWTVQSAELKKKFSQLTDEDLKFETGQETELLTRIGTRLEKTNEEVISILQEGQPAKV